MKSFIKAFYILIVALTVFLGGLLIWQGAAMPREMPAQTGESVIERFEFPPLIFYLQEGSAM